MDYNKKVRTSAPKAKKYGDERDLKTPFGEGEHMRKLANYNSTMPPRQREGQQHAGGKRLRKAKAALIIRQSRFVPNMPNAKTTKCTFPGSMKV